MLSLKIYSQSFSEAAELYNEGLDIINSDPESAIEKFEKCLEMCSELGEETEQVRVNAEIQLPIAYYKVAKRLYDDKNYEEAIKGFKKTAEVADEYGDTETKEKSENYIPRLYLMAGYNYYKAGNMETAISNYDNAIKADASYGSAYYYKSMALLKEKKYILAIDELKKTVENSKDDTKTADKAKEKLSQVYSVLGSDELGKKNYEKAVEHYNNAIKYDPKSSKAYFQLAAAYNNTSAYDDAITAANKALENSNGSAEDKAGIYFELGKAHKNKGEIEAACEAYKNAQLGAYVENAKYQREVILKCE
ncbi:tetratricopeptide repeat protein [Bacteroidota bacterium]